MGERGWRGREGRSGEAGVRGKRRGRRTQEEPERGDPDGAREEDSSGPGQTRGGDTQQRQAAPTHPLQETQAVPQLRRSRHDAGHLPAPPHFRPAPGSSNHRVGLVQLTNRSHGRALRATVNNLSLNQSEDRDQGQTSLQANCKALRDHTRGS